jgi:glycosyltransferase involved in cell wall biosynthesis
MNDSHLSPLASGCYEVTIGIPVYHAVRYIADTLRSALEQTFPSIEFLVLDDCGNDGSMDIVRQLQQDHPRGRDIRIVSQPRNMGIGQGRNRIIDEARGNWLFYLDADDLLPPTAVATLYEAAKKHDAQIVYGSNERVFDLGGEQRVERECYEPMVFLKGDDFANYAYEEYGRIPANVWKYLIDINVYRSNGLRFPDINFWEDFAMTMDLPTYVERAVMLKDITYRYFCRNNTLSNNQKRERIEKQEIERIAAAIARLKDEGLRLKGHSYYLKRCAKVMMTEFYMACYVLSHESVITPSFSNGELRQMMRSPLSLSEVCGLGKWKLKNLALWLLGVMPAGLSVKMIKLLGKRKGLV